MIALTVTCRPQWQPWLLHQLAKQETPHQLVVFDDCVKPLTWPSGAGEALVIRPEGRLRMSLGEKRQAVMAAGAEFGQSFAWFDDDDWHPKERLLVGEAMLGDLTDLQYSVDAVGYAEGLFCDVQSLQTRRLDVGQRVCFNSAVFSAACAKHKFPAMNRGEDTMWLQQVLKDACVVTTPIMQHCWMSHDGNVTGKRGSMSFEGPRFQRFDSWELDFLKRMR